MKKFISKSMQKRIAIQKEAMQVPLRYEIKSSFHGELPHHIIQIWTKPNGKNSAFVAEIVFNTCPYHNDSECGCGAKGYDINKTAIVEALVKGGIKINPVPW